MRRILVYLSPTGRFDAESRALLSVQVDNGREFGWRGDNTLLLTDFAFGCDGVRTVIIGKEHFPAHSPISSKVSAVVAAFGAGLVGNGLHWVHDLDAFQEHPIGEGDIGLGGPWDMGACHFGRLSKWSGGSVWFHAGAGDIFRMLDGYMKRRKMVDEDALTELTQWHSDVYNRVKKVNVAYNFVPFNVRSCWEMADKPLRVVHFDPFGGIRQRGVGSALAFYRGDNPLGLPLVSDRLVDIFGRHGICR